MSVTFSKSIEDALHCVCKQREEYLKRRIREVWQKPYLRNIASKFLYLYGTPLHLQQVSPEGTYQLRQNIRVDCKPKILSRVFLK